MVEPTPPRVLHCIYDDPRNPWVAGGGAVRVFEIYRRLQPQLSSITVATGAFPGARDETIDGVRYRRLGAKRPYVWSRATYAAAASHLLTRGDFDVAVFDFSTYVPLLIPRGRPIGLTVHHITGNTAKERWGRVLGTLIARQEEVRLRRCRQFTATSGATERQLRSIVGSSAEIRLVMAGVPDHLFGLRRADAGYLLYFGRLDWHHKGLDVLLDAMRRLVDVRPEVRLKVAGRGNDITRLTEAVRERRLESAVEVIGPVEDAERDRLFAGAAALLMPSRFEGFGMAAAEAMAAGVPVVASNAGSLPEVVDPPNGGLVVPVGDAEALAAAAQRLLVDDDLRSSISRTARLSAERFRWERIADQHLAFLHAVRTHKNQ